MGHQQAVEGDAMTPSVRDIMAIGQQVSGCPTLPGDDIQTAWTNAATAHQWKKDSPKTGTCVGLAFVAGAGLYVACTWKEKKHNGNGNGNGKGRR